jgi:hypothetical protein
VKLASKHKVFSNLWRYMFFIRFYLPLFIIILLLLFVLITLIFKVLVGVL